MQRDFAHEIMLDFAERTGLSGGAHPPVRYLWTDAFAVCHFVGRFEREGDRGSLRLALELVDQTHHVLGRHRPDDPRTGWISGLSEPEGERHPTIGGLRIGKPRPERRPDEPFDAVLEWDRDGQYFHYLTRWMHALERVAGATGEGRYHRFACELARTACAAFIRPSAGGARGLPRSPNRHLHWKMSIDLGRPQVASEGAHDPVDGFVTCCELQAGHDESGADLGPEIRELAALCRGRSLDTDDLLGIGCLLCDAWRLAQLPITDGSAGSRLLEGMLQSALRGLRSPALPAAFGERAEGRLAFRELGLAIGLHAVGRLAHSEPADARVGALIRELMRNHALAGQIEGDWCEPARRSSRAWRDHRDINDVMLATSLDPAGYLTVGGGKSFDSVDGTT